MRAALKSIEGERRKFSGIFSRAGVKSSYGHGPYGHPGHPKQTILLTQICDASGQVVTDHLWFNLTKGFMELGLQSGDVVEFDARVKAYVKGYRGRGEDFDSPVSTDYKLSHPTRLRKLGVEREWSTESVVELPGLNPAGDSAAGGKE